MQAQPQQEGPKEPEEGLQPSALEVGMHHGLSLWAKGAGVEDVYKACQIQACGDGSVEKPLAEDHGDLWDQGGIQICPLAVRARILDLIDHRSGPVWDLLRDHAGGREVGYSSGGRARGAQHSLVGTWGILGREWCLGGADAHGHCIPEAGEWGWHCAGQGLPHACV